MKMALAFGRWVTTERSTGVDQFLYLRALLYHQGSDKPLRAIGNSAIIGVLY